MLCESPWNIKPVFFTGAADRPKLDIKLKSVTIHANPLAG